MTTHYHT